MKHAILANKRIGVFGKSESGKSTISVLLAQALRSYGYEKLVNFLLLTIWKVPNSETSEHD